MHATRLELVRRGTNEIFRDASIRIVVRVTSANRLETVRRSLGIASAVSEAGGPVVAPLSQSVIFVGDDEIATLWPMGDEPKRLDGFKLGSLLRRLHDVPPPAAVVAWDVTPRIVKRLEAAGDSERFRGYTKFLLEELARITERFDAVQPGRQVLIHGDAHLGNLVLLDGELRLIDLDDIAFGPREADFAPLMITIRRFGRDPEEFMNARRAYGHQLDEQLLDAYASLRQITMTSWLLSIISWRPEAEEELRYRISTWGSADQWRPL